MAGTFKDLVVWQKSIDLAKSIYMMTEKFPKSEIYGLTNQLRRAAVSVPSNIAEGQARFSNAEFKHFLRNAKGSLAEIETQIILARELGYCDAKAAAANEKLLNDVGRLASGLINSLEKRSD